MFLIIPVCVTYTSFHLIQRARARSRIHGAPSLRLRAVVLLGITLNILTKKSEFYIIKITPTAIENFVRIEIVWAFVVCLSSCRGNRSHVLQYTYTEELTRTCIEVCQYCADYLMYTCVNKNPSALNFLSPKLEVTCGKVAIIIRVVLLFPYLRIRAVSLSSIHYNQSHRVYINRRGQYICLI